MVHATHRWEIDGHLIAGSIEECFEKDVVWLPESDDESNEALLEQREVEVWATFGFELVLRPGHYNLVDTYASDDAVDVSGYEADVESDEPCAKR